MIAETRGRGAVALQDVEALISWRLTYLSSICVSQAVRLRLGGEDDAYHEANVFWADPTVDPLFSRIDLVVEADTVAGTAGPRNEET